MVFMVAFIWLIPKILTIAFILSTQECWSYFPNTWTWCSSGLQWTAGCCRLLHAHVFKHSTTFMLHSHTLILGKKPWRYVICHLEEILMIIKKFYIYFYLKNIIFKMFASLVIVSVMMSQSSGRPQLSPHPADYHGYQDLPASYSYNYE